MENNGILLYMKVFIRSTYIVQKILEQYLKTTLPSPPLLLQPLPIKLLILSLSPSNTPTSPSPIFYILPSPPLPSPLFLTSSPHFLIIACAAGALVTTSKSHNFADLLSRFLVLARLAHLTWRPNFWFWPLCITRPTDTQGISIVN